MLDFDEKLLYLILPPNDADDKDGFSRPRIVRTGGLHGVPHDQSLSHLVGFIPSLENLASKRESPTIAMDVCKLMNRWTEIVFGILHPFSDDSLTHTKPFWIFDFVTDIATFTDRSTRHRCRLSALTSQSTMDDFEAAGPAPPPIIDPIIISQQPFWEPKVEVHPRIRAFSHRLLLDFGVQMKRVLRAEYSRFTSRLLVHEILNLCTLDFEIKLKRKTEYRNCPFESLKAVLASWKQLDTDFIRVGGIYVVICQSLQEGLSMAQQHLQSPEFTATKNMARDGDGPLFLLISVRAIALCRITDSGFLQSTAPQCLFDGASPTSDLALDYLIWATESARATAQTPLQALPIEIQTRIINHIDDRPVAAAKIGCELGIGLPFLWEDGSEPLVLAPCVGREKVMFDGLFTGLSYHVASTKCGHECYH